LSVRDGPSRRTLARAAARTVATSSSPDSVRNCFKPSFGFVTSLR